ncbi:hypothetical protein HKCCE3408_01205 [Rhodobacterales bacterium HKCCE3408]|nr:hypothetical protein [Rhodobacterales bacterium HKCCE3408]
MSRLLVGLAAGLALSGCNLVGDLTGRGPSPDAAGIASAFDTVCISTLPAFADWEAQADLLGLTDATEAGARYNAAAPLAEARVFRVGETASGAPTCSMVAGTSASIEEIAAAIDARVPLDPSGDGYRVGTAFLRLAATEIEGTPQVTLTLIGGGA